MLSLLCACKGFELLRNVDSMVVYHVYRYMNCMHIIMAIDLYNVMLQCNHGGGLLACLLGQVWTTVMKSDQNLIMQQNQNANSSKYEKVLECKNIVGSYLHILLGIFTMRIDDYADIRRNSASEETCQFSSTTLDFGGCMHRKNE